MPINQILGTFYLMRLDTWYIFQFSTILEDRGRRRGVGGGGGDNFCDCLFASLDSAQNHFWKGSTLKGKFAPKAPFSKEQKGL